MRVCEKDPFPVSFNIEAYSKQHTYLLKKTGEHPARRFRKNLS